MDSAPIVQQIKIGSADKCLSSFIKAEIWMQNPFAQFAERLRKAPFAQSLIHEFCSVCRNCIKVISSCGRE